MQPWELKVAVSQERWTGINMSVQIDVFYTDPNFLHRMGSIERLDRGCSSEPDDNTAWLIRS